MTRFILLTFGFLGWAFWEMSGGDEFELQAWSDVDGGGAVRMAAADPAPAQDEGYEFVTRAGMSPLSIRPEGRPEGEEMLVQASLSTSNSAAAETLGQWSSAPNVLDALTVATSAPQAEARNVVAVAGSRVNMRTGPGTEHSVVVTLPRGTEATVLETRDGWVHLDVTSTGQSGWMAAYLVEGI
ncbi:hypothetical protein OG2516_08623 [Oceanicola granulosus HTCC2516]|uniref:SH3b domain-containing protein n=1 Tax=Oceanicola granulosus (strain ATCC BAA-861 / DSM 15982 / KCTC 12143 / HTCC2516) TaxID=314256 RepID=Q2CAX1_OCEGH|nr:SH3 domain-containing protein [Oceanicola granulosus]EAR49805.1 hypothetical protein OG2516_08623 [Oceanicola granulosus HTCC2516]